MKFTVSFLLGCAVGSAIGWTMFGFNRDVILPWAVFVATGMALSYFAQRREIERGVERGKA